eukprot:TRINITY_DN1084_c0_g1_i1.p1 TRINITY_DN1084_c0_g1~~TRINITY_DN1084_c0_g1_i1.p1  ORF type:complete len:382 (+),score=170.38 TRINITY_DN1084_c0_g1_i1:69-1214(+)
MAMSRIAVLALVSVVSATNLTSTNGTNVTSTNGTNATSSASQVDTHPPAPPVNVTSTNMTSTNVTQNVTSSNATSSNGTAPNVTSSSKATVTEPQTKVPSPPPAKGVTVTWCTEDSNCRVAGDAQATCAKGTCTCSEGFAHGASPQGTPVPLCMPVDAEPATLAMLFSFVFPGGKCAAIDMPQLLTTQKAAFTFVAEGERAAMASASTCGSIHTAVSAEMTAYELVDGMPADFAAQVEAAVRGVAALDEHVGEAPMTMTVRVADPASSCQAPNAAVSVLFELASGETVCKAVSCEDGFAQDADGVCAASREGAAGSGLSGGAIAGIVIAVLVVVGMAGAAAFFVLNKNQKDVQSADFNNMGGTRRSDARAEPVSNPSAEQC